MGGQVEVVVCVWGAGHNRLINVIDKWPSYECRELSPLRVMDVIYQRGNGGALAGWSWRRRGEAI